MTELMIWIQSTGVPQLSETQQWYAEASVFTSDGVFRQAQLL